MTEQPITCRSVCERLVEWQNKGPSNRAWVDTIASDARLALAQPDGDADLRAQLDAANKRAEEAEAKQREAENAVAEQAEKIMEINRCVGFWQAMAETIIDRLVGRSAV